MKLMRYKTDKPEYKAVLDGDKVKRINGSIFGDYLVSEESLNVSDVTFLPPVLPTKIIGLRGNYSTKDREPLFYMKPRTSITAHNTAVIYPTGLDKVMAEAELAIIISKKCRNVKEAHAEQYILGYTIANDITGISSDFKETFTESKWYDTFTPLGPVIDTKCNYDNLNITSRLNGEIVQQGNTKDMVFKPPFIVARLSSVMTLEAGDAILLGTPPPSFEIAPGDKIDIEIQDIGVLSNYIE